MPIALDQTELRVLGCLLEKAVVTPDQYPLTLNSLVNACNQKSSRHPVMNLSPGEVEHTLRALQEKRLIRTDENFRTRVEKFAHRFCNTPFSDYQFDTAQYAVVCVLMLRGPRTPGELRANAGRLYSFADNEEVLATLRSLEQIEKGPLVKRLPRTPGRKDAEYVHLFGESPATEPSIRQTGAVERAAMEAPAGAVRTSTTDSGRSDTAPVDLAARVAALEDQVRALRATLAQLRDELKGQD